MPICDICCESLNKSIRKPIPCCACDISVCSSCVKNYLINSSDLNPNCMGCNILWTPEFLNDSLSKGFLKGEYKKHQADLMFDREKSLLPETLPEAEEIHLLRKYKEVKAQIEHLGNNNNAAYVALKAKKRLLFREYYVKMLLNKNAKIAKTAFTRFCPTEACKGFLTHEGNCGLCEMWACKGCHETIGRDKDMPHTCDPSTLETSKLIANDSKPCPKCHAFIFKIDGCNQMYCTQCHTPFSWNTGLIETGRIHNPHYYEYQRSVKGGIIPPEVGNEFCRMPNVDDISNDIYVQYRETLTNIFHTRYMINREIVNLNTDPININRKARIAYLLDDINEKTFKSRILTNNKIFAEKNEERLVLQMAADTIADIAHRMVSTACTDANVRSFLIEFNTIRDYATDCFAKISKRYNLKLKNRVNWW